MKEIILTNGAIAKVNNSDFKKVNEINWTIQKRKNTNYALGRPHLSSPISMHRFIMNPPKGMVIDHINFDGLDNRRENLRICTQTENLNNRKNLSKNINKKVIKSIYEGVYWNNSKTKCQSYIYFDGKKIHLGLFGCEEDASKAYNDKKKELYEDYKC